MANEKDKPASVGDKSTKEAPDHLKAEPSVPVSDTRRIIREAAWSRMFGRIEEKNPFSR